MAMNPLPKAWEKYIFVTSNSFHFVSILVSGLLLMSGFCKGTWQLTISRGKITELSRALVYPAQSHLVTAGKVNSLGLSFQTRTFPGLLAFFCARESSPQGLAGIQIPRSHQKVLYKAHFGHFYPSDASTAGLQTTIRVALQCTMNPKENRLH